MPLAFVSEGVAPGVLPLFAPGAPERLPAPVPAPPRLPPAPSGPPLGSPVSFIDCDSPVVGFTLSGVVFSFLSPAPHAAMHSSNAAARRTGRVIALSTQDPRRGSAARAA